MALSITAPATAQENPSKPWVEPTSEAHEDSLWTTQSNVGYGPYHQVALGFFNSVRLGFTPRAPTSLLEGTFEVRATESWAKDIAQKDNAFDLDYEVMRTEASIAYGVSDSAFLELDFDTATRVHGILDPLMNGFHNTFGIPLGPRGRLPDNSFRIELQPGEGRPPINQDHDAGNPFTRALVLSIQHALTYGDELWPALSYSVSLRPEVEQSEALHGGSPLDLSVSMSLSKSFGKFTLYLAADYSFYGTESYAGTALRVDQWGTLSACEWNCLADFSLVGQCLSTGPPVTSFERFLLC